MVSRGAGGEGGLLFCGRGAACGDSQSNPKAEPCQDQTQSDCSKEGDYGRPVPAIDCPLRVHPSAFLFPGRDAEATGSTRKSFGSRGFNSSSSAPPNGFWSAGLSSQEGSCSPAKFLAYVGPPPKHGSPQKVQQPETMPEDEPAAPLEEMEEVFPAQTDMVSQMLMKQQVALNTLVAHLAFQDSFQDLGMSGSASSSISLKGSAERERLLADLAARKSDFFLKVAQNAYRRLRPPEAVRQALGDFPPKALFTKYLERQGGYTGYQREQGLTMRLLGHVADQLLAGDVKGAQEMLALAMVAIEQSAMDNGKWEIAWILASQEDPSQQLFAHRAPATNPRLRAFGPLCPADWGAIALAYVKELDPLSSRRAEALPRKQGAKSEDPEDGTDNTKKPKQPRYPRRPKAQGGGASSETA